MTQKIAQYLCGSWAYCTNCLGICK